MKIYPSFTPDKNRIHSRKEKKHARETGRMSFADALDSEVSGAYNQTVESLLSDLEEKERRFLDQQTLADLNEYKRIVKKILELVVQEGFETKTVTSRRALNPREYFLVNRIDEALRDLALAVTSPASRPFNVLKQCEEIRGLIFDLVK